MKDKEAHGEAAPQKTVQADVDGTEGSSLSNVSSIKKVMHPLSYSCDEVTVYKPAAVWQGSGLLLSGSIKKQNLGSSCISVLLVPDLDTGVKRVGS